MLRSGSSEFAMKILVAVLVMSLLSGCCTQIGCIGRTSFILTEAEAMAFGQGASTVRVCLNDNCRSIDSAGALDGSDFSNQWEAETRTLRVLTGTPAALERVDVTLTITRGDDELLQHSWADVRYEKVNPNGAFCPAACANAGPLSSP